MSRKQNEAIIRQCLKGWRREIPRSSSRSLLQTSWITCTANFAPATRAEIGKRATITGMIMVRIKEGKMVEGWGEHDRLGHLQQLGVVPGGEEYRQWVRERFSAAT